ncbi:voltage-gated potassium channel beta 2 [Heterobasidion irregulare TC 32-1]|uniref:Voltage-gated potassium channel beta 2 n=1 Tax=Heterobasidion irregulare (strain TC 32-1) TaxID=747525 RepID=W4KLV0_HETIT|nr:voltage-gated potassium channel beta 2 [Heterobasidion irregulare TC 32-1]ETW86782.1 voltage-gated potassium channel beta 2 [Heterobasidion irregulare TC 32-1]
MSGSEVKLEYQQKNMPFRRLGSSGLRVPVFSLGGWLTFGGTVVGDPVKDIVKTAFENGINMFDEAEAYAKGQSEVELGRVLKELGLRRTDIIVTTKLYWGAERKGPNDQGLSRKHIVEGTKESLQRLQLDYVDVIFAHRPDHTVPMEEVVRAFHWVIEQGLAFYWGTSEWSAREIEEAHHVADKYGLHAPVAEQCQHNLVHRERPEGEYGPLYQKYNMGTTVWSALAGGILTGKYNNGVPDGSRLDTNKEFLAHRLKFLESEEGKKQIEIVKQLTAVAETELGCKVSHLALAWVAKNTNTSTVILGATSPEQIVDNLKALDVIPKLTPEILAKIEAIVNNKPAPPPDFGRPGLDPHGRL